MTYRCPVCQRSSSEPGFCPDDGTRLVDEAAAQQATLIAPGTAADDATTGVTSPTTSSDAAIDTRAPTIAKDPAPDKSGPVLAFSAATHNAEAMDSIRRNKNEYDRLIGQTLDGRYYVERKLGEGGMGVVFAVKHAVIERPLAIKVLKRDALRDQATLQRFIQEARAASRIGHPNIVDVTDFGNTSDGMTYQVMELIEGTTLSKIIKEGGPVPVERALRIAIQIARALAAAHAKGIVHRDLKPENVFLTEREGRPDFVKIVDFGIAKVQPIDGTKADGPRLTRQGSVFGTPEYMAPEQAAGKGDTDHRVDIYALGIIVYQMLVGKVPHKGNSMIRTIAMQMLDTITPPRQARPGLEITDAVEAVIMKALAKKREDRFATMSDMLTALEAAEVNQLAALDAHATPTSDVVAAETLLAEGPGGPRRNKPPTRPLHEPEFVAAPPISLSRVLEESPPDEDDRGSRWPMIVAGLAMLVLGAGGAIFIIMKLQGDRTVATTTPRDAALLTSELHDAGTSEPDAMQVIAEVPIDAGTRITPTPRDAGVPTVVTTTTGTTTTTTNTTRPPKGNVTIEVLTRPGDADVFVGVNYRGPSGTRISERAGTKLKIECKTSNMKGSVEVVFDGKVSAVMCTATRARFCVPGLKNPYDDCEDDPNALP